MLIFFLPQMGATCDGFDTFAIYKLAINSQLCLACLESVACISKLLLLFFWGVCHGYPSLDSMLLEAHFDTKHVQFSQGFEPWFAICGGLTTSAIPNSRWL